MRNKTFVDVFYCKKFFYVHYLKDFSQSIRGYLGILELKEAAIATLKRKIRDGSIPGIIEYIQIKVFHHVACF